MRAKQKKSEFVSQGDVAVLYADRMVISQLVVENLIGIFYSERASRSNFANNSEK
jgi:hypothetical protein